LWAKKRSPPIKKKPSKSKGYEIVLGDRPERDYSENEQNESNEIGALSKEFILTLRRCDMPLILPKTPPYCELQLLKEMSKMANLLL